MKNELGRKIMMLFAKLRPKTIVIQQTTPMKTNKKIRHKKLCPKVKI